MARVRADAAALRQDRPHHKSRMRTPAGATLEVHASSSTLSLSDPSACELHRNPQTLAKKRPRPQRLGRNRGSVRLWPDVFEFGHHLQSISSPAPKRRIRSGLAQRSPSICVTRYSPHENVTQSEHALAVIAVDAVILQIRNYGLGQATRSRRNRLFGVADRAVLTARRSSAYDGDGRTAEARRL